MKLFTFLASAYRSRFAIGTGLLDQSMKRVVLCPVCKSIHCTLTDDLTIVAEGKGPFPDLFSYSFYFILSKKAIDIFNIPYSKKVTVYNKTTRTYNYDYYMVDLTPKIVLDYEKMGVVVTHCPRCGAPHWSKPTQDFGVPYFRLLGDYESLPPVFCVEDFPYVCCCTEDFLKQVVQHKLTNFYFGPFEEKFNYSYRLVRSADAIKKLL